MFFLVSFEIAPPPSNEIPEYPPPAQPEPNNFYGPPPQHPSNGFYTPPAQFEIQDNLYRHSNTHHEANQQRQHHVEHQHEPVKYDRIAITTTSKFISMVSFQINLN